MNPQKGFIQIPLLVIIIVSIIAASAGTGVVLYKPVLAPFIASVSEVFQGTKDATVSEEELEPEDLQPKQESESIEEDVTLQEEVDTKIAINEVETTTLIKEEKQTVVEEVVEPVIPKLSITGIIPSNIFDDVRTSISIAGRNFKEGSRVTIGGIFVDSFFVNDNMITVEISPKQLSVNRYSVQVINPDGSAATTSITLSVTESPRPIITSVSPKEVDPTIGDFTLTIKGSKFEEELEVKIGGQTFGKFNLIDSRTAEKKVSITNILLPNTSASVQVTNPNGKTYILDNALRILPFATVEIGAPEGSGGTVDPANNINVMQSTWTISKRGVWLKELELRHFGSLNNIHLKNFRLYVDEVQVASTDITSGEYINLVPLSPYKLSIGSRAIKVLVDIVFDNVSGDTRTVMLSLRNKDSIVFVHPDYKNINITPLGIFPSSSPQLIVN